MKKISTTPPSKATKWLQKTFKFCRKINKQKVQHNFSLLTIYLSTLLFLVSSLSLSNQHFAALHGDWDIMQRQWLPGEKSEMGPIARERAHA